MIILCTMLSSMSEIPTYYICLHRQILPPIKQNEEILQLFPHFALFSILYSPDSRLQNYYISLIPANILHKKVFNSLSTLHRQLRCPLNQPFHKKRRSPALISSLFHYLVMTGLPTAALCLSKMIL